MYTLSGSKYRNFINEGSKEAIPTFTCENEMSVEYGDETYSLMKGKNYNANLVLLPGDNYMHFTGDGEVIVSYREVSL